LETRLKTLTLLLIMLCTTQKSACWTNPTYQRVSKSKVTNALIWQLYPLFHIYTVHG
jgi:glutathionylspermidine synthase